MTLNWLLEHTDLPYEADEVTGLTVMHALCNWQWGARVLFAHPGVHKYLFTRTLKPYAVLIQKYDLVCLGIKMAAQYPGLIEPAIMLSMNEFQAQGAYGGAVEEMEVGMM